MYKHPLIPWALAMFGITMAIIFSIRAAQQTERAQRAESQLQRQEIARTRSDSMQPAIFVRIDGSTIQYTIPTVVTVGNETYVDATPQTATIDQEVAVFGSVNGTGIAALSGIAEGTRISIVSSTDEQGATTVHSIVVIP